MDQTGLICCGMIATNIPSQDEGPWCVKESEFLMPDCKSKPYYQPSTTVGADIMFGFFPNLLLLCIMGSSVVLSGESLQTELIMPAMFL